MEDSRRTLRLAEFVADSLAGCRRWKEILTVIYKIWLMQDYAAILDSGVRYLLSK
jgi:hypothetical protein